jgi:hypothetical protein
MCSRVVTNKWYGFYTFKNKERARSFHALVEDNFAEHVYPHVHKIIFPSENADLTDVMYALLPIILLGIQKTSYIIDFGF